MLEKKYSQWQKVGRSAALLIGGAMLCWSVSAQSVEQAVVAPVVAQVEQTGLSESVAQQTQNMTVGNALEESKKVDMVQVQQTEPTKEAAPVRPEHTLAWSEINTGDTAWMLTATALVLMMVFPGLALFYAGMSRKKHTISTAAMVFATAVVAAVMWMLVGYSIAFGKTGSFLGGFDALFLKSLVYDKSSTLVSVHPNAPTIPEHLFMMFQMSFAIITPALIVGAFVERIRFGAALVFAAAWSVLVYAPVAHWVWSSSGFMHKIGVLDFAGGLVVHVNSGIAGLVVALILGARKGHLEEGMPPSNLVLTMAGAGLLLIGWFGFNAGSAGGSNVQAGLAIANTMIAASTGSIAWMLIEWKRRGFPSLLGMTSGLIAGLVAITPACGFVSPVSALVIGILGGVSAYFACSALKRKLKYDDSLDAFGVHGVAGIVGSVVTGIFATATIFKNGDILIQILGTLMVGLYTAVMTAIIVVVIKKFMQLRSDDDEEEMGLDIANHAEQLE